MYSPDPRSPEPCSPRRAPPSCAHPLPQAAPPPNRAPQAALPCSPSRTPKPRFREKRSPEPLSRAPLAPSLPHSHSYSLSLTPPLLLSLAHSPTHPLSHSPTLPLSLSLSHSHTLTLSHSHSQILSHSHSLSSLYCSDPSEPCFHFLSFFEKTREILVCFVAISRSESGPASISFIAAFLRSM